MPPQTSAWLSRSECFSAACLPRSGVVVSGFRCSATTFCRFRRACRAKLTSIDRSQDPNEAGSLNESSFR